MSDNKNKNIFYVNHRGEVLFWLIILLIVSIVIFLCNIRNSKLDNEYNIFMNDVDGLIVGSPVKAMGIEVGHVTKIKPLRDEVFIKFRITDKSVKIPQGTIATVEFSGMAGSKSLELYLPDKKTYIDSSVPIITVNPPKRLHDAAGMLNYMFKKIGDMITISSQFGHKLSEIDFPEKKGNSTNPKEFLKFADDLIDRSQARIDNLGRKLNYAKQ